MKRRSLIAVAMTLVLAAQAVGQSAAKPATGSDTQPLAVLLEQGIYQEETAGNLDAAAKTYVQIVDQAAVGRALVAQALSRLVALQVKQKQLEEARKTIERLRTEYPEQKDAIAKAAALLPSNAQKSTIAGGGHSERPQESEHVPTAEEKSQAAELAKQGWQSYREGKNESAADAFRRAIELDPKSIDGLNGMGWTLLNAQKSGSGEYFGKALKLDPKNVTALNGMGWSVLNAHSASGRSNFGISPERQRSIPEAVKYWRQATEIDPTATSPISGLAQCAWETYQFDDAVKWYDRWLKLEPNNAEAAKGLERAKAAQNSVEVATPVALEFLKCVDEGRLEDAKQLVDNAGGFMVGDQGDRSTWQSWRSDFPVSTGFSTIKFDKWGEMMKEFRGTYGQLIERKLSSVRGPTSRSPDASPFGEAQGKNGRGFFGYNNHGMMIFNFAPRFENDRRAAETVILQKTKNDEWKVHGYSLTRPVVPRDPLKTR